MGKLGPRVRPAVWTPGLDWIHEALSPACAWVLGWRWDGSEIAVTEKPGAATKLLYQLYIALQKKKKGVQTRVEMPTVQPLMSTKVQNMKSEAFRDVSI